MASPSASSAMSAASFSSSSESYYSVDVGPTTYEAWKAQLMADRRPILYVPPPVMTPEEEAAFEDAVERRMEIVRTNPRQLRLTCIHYHSRHRPDGSIHRWAAVWGRSDAPAARAPDASRGLARNEEEYAAWFEEDRVEAERREQRVHTSALRTALGNVRRMISAPTMLSSSTSDLPTLGTALSLAPSTSVAGVAVTSTRVPRVRKSQSTPNASTTTGSTRVRLGFPVVKRPITSSQGSNKSVDGHIKPKSLSSSGPDLLRPAGDGPRKRQKRSTSPTAAGKRPSQASLRGRSPPLASPPPCKGRIDARPTCSSNCGTDDTLQEADLQEELRLGKHLESTTQAVPSALFTDFHQPLDFPADLRTSTPTLTSRFFQATAPPPPPPSPPPPPPTPPSALTSRSTSMAIATVSSSRPPRCSLRALDDSSSESLGHRAKLAGSSQKSRPTLVPLSPATMAISKKRQRPLTLNPPFADVLDTNPRPTTTLSVTTLFGTGSFSSTAKIGKGPATSIPSCIRKSTSLPPPKCPSIAPHAAATRPTAGTAVCRPLSHHPSIPHPTTAAALPVKSRSAVMAALTSVPSHSSSSSPASSPPPPVLGIVNIGEDPPPKDSFPTLASSQADSAFGGFGSFSPTMRASQLEQRLEDISGFLAEEDLGW